MKTVDVNYNNGNPSIDQSSAIDLKNGDKVTLHLKDFPAGYVINAVTFYGNTTTNGVDSKNTSDVRGSWQLGPFADFKVHANDSGDVEIKDVENNDSDDKYWYGVQISTSTGAVAYNLDPELINKGSKDGG